MLDKIKKTCLASLCSAACKRVKNTMYYTINNIRCTIHNIMCKIKCKVRSEVVIGTFKCFHQHHYQ